MQGCVAYVNGRDGEVRVRLKGPFPNLIYTSSREIQARQEEQFVTFKIVRAGETTGPAKVRYRTVNGTAKAGRDYVAAAGELTFASLEVSKEIELTLTSTSEFSTSFQVELSDAVGAEIRGSPMSVLILGKKPRFAERPIQILTNGAVLLHFDRSGSGNWGIEYSENLIKWTPLFLLGDNETFDFETTTSGSRFYRWRKY